MRILLGTALLLSPVVVWAQPPKDFRELVGVFLTLIDVLVILLFGLALIVFLWGLTEAWILGGGDEQSIEKGKKIALAGVIGLVVMSGVWGIVALIAGGFFGVGI